MNKSKKIMWSMILILSMIVVIVSAVFIAMHFFGKNYNGDTLLNPSSKETSEISVSSPLESQSETELIDNPIDFSSLKEINSDIYAWIRIPDTEIDYPILQAGEGRDDYFYLSHNVEGNYEFAGSIYSEKQNAKDFSDPVTVLYGHNMLNGTMFADLHKFENEDFFNTHESVYIYTPGHILTYQVYAAYVYDDRHILNSFDFSDKAVVAEYFASTLNPATMTCMLRTGITLDHTDTILTLSTCTNGNKNTRYLVQGVLLNDERTK